MLLKSRMRVKNFGEKKIYKAKQDCPYCWGKLKVVEISEKNKKPIKYLGCSNAPKCEFTQILDNYDRKKLSTFDA